MNVVVKNFVFKIILSVIIAVSSLSFAADLQGIKKSESSKSKNQNTVLLKKKDKKKTNAPVKEKFSEQITEEEIKEIDEILAEWVRKELLLQQTLSKDDNDNDDNDEEFNPEITKEVDTFLEQDACKGK